MIQNSKLKGLLNEDIIVPSHTEVEVFVKSDIINLECEKVQIKG